MGGSGQEKQSGVTAALRRSVVGLARREGRQVGTPGHDVARDFLLERLAGAGLQPYAGGAFDLRYRAGGTELANVIGVAAGGNRRLPPVLVGAHYDTAGRKPGADDNAAAVSIALWLAERLTARAAARDVLIALFDGEEPPHFLTPTMGSIVFTREQQRKPVHAAIVLDLVGHEVPLPGAEDVLFVTGMESDPGLEHAVLAVPEDPRLRLVTALDRYVGDVSDHHAFRVTGAPYLFLTCGRWRHYHRASDTPEVLAYGKMAAVAEATEALVRDLAGRELGGPHEGYDTTATDLRLMRAALGPLLHSYGLPLDSRADIERAAALLIGQIGI